MNQHRKINNDHNNLIMDNIGGGDNNNSADLNENNSTIENKSIFSTADEDGNYPVLDFDCIIIDLVMPGELDGPLTCQKIRNIGKIDFIQVLTVFCFFYNFFFCCLASYLSGIIYPYDY